MRIYLSVSRYADEGVVTKVRHYLENICGHSVRQWAVNKGPNDKYHLSIIDGAEMMIVVSERCNEFIGKGQFDEINYAIESLNIPVYNINSWYGLDQVTDTSTMLNFIKEIKVDQVEDTSVIDVADYRHYGIINYCIFTDRFNLIEFSVEIFEKDISESITEINPYPLRQEWNPEDESTESLMDEKYLLIRLLQ